MIVIDYRPLYILSNNCHCDNIYITRRNNEIRQLLNESEIESILKEYDFKTIDLENLSVAEQISTFSKAKNIVSPHGAALINTIYSKNCKIMELIGNIDKPNDYYWYAAYYSLSHVLNNGYYCLPCEEHPIRGETRVRKQIYNLWVSTVDFRSLLEKMMSD